MLSFRRRKQSTTRACSRFLPPYSYDFNPIESGWALIKKRIRTIAPRTAHALRTTAQRARRVVRPHHCHSWFTHIGYQLTCSLGLERSDRVLHLFRQRLVIVAGQAQRRAEGDPCPASLRHLPGVVENFVEPLDANRDDWHVEL